MNDNMSAIIGIFNEVINLMQEAIYWLREKCFQVINTING